MTVRAALRKLRRLFSDPPPPCDAETLAVLTRVLRPEANAVDIGANRGSILREIVRLAPRGRHWAFEPIPRLAGRLARAYPRVACRQLAVSDAPGTASFNLYAENDGFSGLVRRQDVAATAGPVSLLTVVTARLDDLLPPDLPIALMKIDVEGAEFRVLSGARQTLQRWKPVVVFECGLGGLDNYGHAPEQVFDLLADAGLEVRPLATWPREAPLAREAFAASFRAGEHFMWVASPAA
jgi:FkbM family methyltransferase